MSGHIVTRGLGGMTLVTRGYGMSAFTAIIRREIKRLNSFITRVLDLESRVG